MLGGSAVLGDRYLLSVIAQNTARVIVGPLSHETDRVSGYMMLSVREHYKCTCSSFLSPEL